MIKQLMALMLMLSISFAWTAGVDYPTNANAQSYTIMGANITITNGSGTFTPAKGHTLSSVLAYPRHSCTGTSSYTMTANGTDVVFTTTETVSGGGTAGYSHAIIFTPSTTQNMTLTYSGIGGMARAARITTANGTVIFFPDGAGTINITQISETIYNITSVSDSKTTTKGPITVEVPVYRACDGGSATATLSFNGNYQVNGSQSSDVNLTLTSGYQSSKIYSDFKNGANFTPATSSYCRSLLYFNNPYYGNVQLIPIVTYIPTVNAFANFFNASDNSAYIPNNTISYIFDSVTSAWYIVPATICTSYSIVGSTSTLQYNPTGITSGTTGEIPIDVNKLSGSCSYVSATRVVTCTGTDSSGTLTSLNLTAYMFGNSSVACSNGAVGSSATLACTLPNVNGTYNIYFYGTDANLFIHSLSSATVEVGTSSQTLFGRDGYLAAVLIVVVAATLMTGSIAVSMMLGVFGLFVAVAFGIIPLATGTVAALFAVVALAIVYKLKV